MKANRNAFLAAWRWVVQLTQQDSHCSKEIDTTTCDQEITLLVLILSWIICNIGKGIASLKKKKGEKKSNNWMIPHWCTRNLVRHLNAQLLPIGNPGFSISPKEQIMIIIIIKKQVEKKKIPKTNPTEQIGSRLSSSICTERKTWSCQVGFGRAGWSWG